MKWGSSSSITVNETEFSPCYIALKKRELTNNIGRCVTKEVQIILHQEQTALGPAFQILHFRSYRDLNCQFKHLVVSAESYHEGAEPNQAKLVRSGKRHKV